MRLLPLAIASFAATAGAQNTKLGGNVATIAGRTFHFVDLVKGSAFGEPWAPTSQNVSVDATGWPTVDFGLSLYSEGAAAAVFAWPAAQIDGIYTVTAVGNATVSVAPGLAGSIVLNQTYDAASNTLLAFLAVPADPVVVGGHIQLAFTSTARQPGDPAAGAGLVNVSVLQPGYPAGTDPETFTGATLASYRRFSLIRVMPWTLAQSSNNPSPPSSGAWSARARVGVPSYLLGAYGTLGPGVPWETCAAFVNALGADIWVNVPPGESLNTTERDEYVVSLVALLNSLLPAAAKIYLEYGNEMWNGHFTGYEVVKLLANRSVMEDGDPYSLNYGLASPPNATANAGAWQPRYYAWTVRHFAALAAGVVGAARVGRADTPGVRVVPVLGVQGDSPMGNGIAMLDYLEAVWGPPAAYGVGTIATGGYISMGPGNTAATLTVEQVIQGFLGTLANASTASPLAYWGHGNPLAGWATLGAYYGLATHAYEASPDTSGSLASQPVALAAKANATQDPRMASIAAENVWSWQAWGGGTFNWFTGGATSLLAPWGSYSVLYDMRVPDTPKARGLDAVLAAPPRPVSAGWPLPLLNHSASMVVDYWPGPLPPPDPVVQWLPVNTTLWYLARLPSPASACAPNVTVYISNHNKTGAGRLEVAVAAAVAPVVLTAPPPGTGGGKTPFLPASAAFPPLPPGGPAGTGLVAVRLRVLDVDCGYSLRAIDVVCSSGGP